MRTFAGAVLSAVLLGASGATARCPFTGGDAAALAAPGRRLQTSVAHDSTPLAPYTARIALPPLSSEAYDRIEGEIAATLRESQDFWPLDFDTYGPLMIRLAWHCSGTYRQSDGRGGCDGGRIRFLPEYAWEDNTNLDKALALLRPLAEKYEGVISWGDLIVLTGNVAIETMGGPVLGFCGGRIDDADGTASLPLGPTPQQESLAPCEVQGECESPLGPSVLGLIYVNPEGPAGATGDPAASAKDIRDVFARMGFNDRETVALVGGGHAFGKTHGACPGGPGPGPIEAPAAPYPGLCDVDPASPRGRANNTFTSGFEGPWTTTPTQWTNAYFQRLRDHDWEQERSPAGKIQFRPVQRPGGRPIPDAPIRMLTADVAFISDPVYKALVLEYADDLEAINRDFAAVWYRLTSQDMGPATRCTGPDVPEPQPFQDTLVTGPAKAPQGLGAAKAAVAALVSGGDAARNTGLLATLAYNCASTFRATHWFGGCNGARIRFPPQADFESNEGLDAALDLLKPIQVKYPDISYADLIVLAGNAASEAAGSAPLRFCPGRADAEDGETSVDLAPRTYYLDPLVAVKDSADIMGLSAADAVALAARPTRKDPTLSNVLFKTLLAGEVWQPVLEGDAVTVDPLEGEYKSADGRATVPVLQWALLQDPELRFYVREFAADEVALSKAYAAAWTKLMNADRFDGPAGNVCDVA